MDPEITLFELRELASNLLWSHPDEDSYRMAELFLSLDGWMTSGGFPPTDWDCRPNA